MVRSFAARSCCRSFCMSCFFYIIANSLALCRMSLRRAIFLPFTASQKLHQTNRVDHRKTFFFFLLLYGMASCWVPLLSFGLVANASGSNHLFFASGLWPTLACGQCGTCPQQTPGWLMDRKKTKHLRLIIKSCSDKLMISI